MITFKKCIYAASTAAIVAGSALAMATPAAAYVTCNREGDCWHTDVRPRAPGVRFDIHPDHWYFHQQWNDDKRHFRDYHEGRGYYRNGQWVTY